MTDSRSPSQPLNSAGARQSQATKLVIAALAAQGSAAAVHAGLSEEVAFAASEAPVLMPGVVVNDASVVGTPSSPKYTEPLADVPQTIEVIPPEVYNAQGATTLSDVLKNTPGITFFAGEGGSANRTGGDSFYLRGFDTSNSIFVDGVRDEGAAVHDTFNIDQVEVFKGPSPDNGRGGTAGYVNLETRAPKLMAFGDVGLSRTFSADGSRASDRLTLDANAPLTALAAGSAIRLDLVDQQGGAPGRQFAENNRWGVAPSLAFGLGTPTRAVVSYEHLYENNLPDYGIPSTAVGGYAPPPAPGGAPLYSPGADLGNYYGFVGLDYEHVTYDAGEFRVEHDFGKEASATNQTRYAVSARKVEASSPSGSVTSAPAGEAAISQGIYQTRNSILSNQTNMKAEVVSGSVEHELTGGLELSRESAFNPIWAVVPLGAANPAYLVSLYSPEDFPASLLNYSPHETGSTTDTRIDTAALYAFDTAKLGKHWELIAGVRAEHYDIDELSVTTASPAVAATAAAAGKGSALPTAPTTAVAAVPASQIDLSSARTTASWKTGIVFKPEPEVSLYGSFDTSLRPPGTSGSTNTLSTTATSADNPLLEPERAQNYEAGVKWSLMGDQLLATAALFRSVNESVPAADPVTGLTDQTSDQSVSGAEVGLAGRVTQAWMVFAGFSDMKAQVSNEISTNAQGLTLPLLPKESGNLWTTYALPKGVTLGAGAQFMGATDRLQATGAPTATTFANGVPDYWVFSAMAEWKVDKRLTLRANVGNVADRTYVASLNNNGYRLNLGPPRTVMVTADYRF